MSDERVQEEVPLGESGAGESVNQVRPDDDADAAVHSGAEAPAVDAQEESSVPTEATEEATDTAEEAPPPGERDSGAAVPAVGAEAAPPATDSAPKDKEAAAEQEPVHEMTFTEHLNELRVRLMRCLLAAFIGLLACYAFAEQLFILLMNPLVVLLEPTGGSLIYTGLPEAFFTHLKVAAVAGLFLVSPYIFYQLWMFIAPGLYAGERKYIIPIALCSALCFVTGAMFGYFIVFPFGFQFFLGYATDFIRPMPSVREYFSFSTSMLFAFGLIFELPLFMLFLSALGIVTYKSLRKYRKFAILGNFVVAAILTPPDVVSQCLMAGPLCILYEIGIWVAYLFGKKPKEDVVEEAAEEGAAAKG
jgi:sec-independent protein translocase protein TatC